MKKYFNKARAITLAVAVFLSICALTAGTVLAKYLSERSSDGLIGSKEFYFASDLLDGKEHTLAPDSKSVTFTLTNHEDELRYSEVEITYTVSVKDEVGTESQTVTGTLAAGEKRDQSVTVNLQPGKNTITVIGNGGYTKMLTATIVVPNVESRLYYYVDKSVSDYILLTVWNEGDEKGAVTVTYTGIPDNTNPNMTDWTVDGGPVKVEVKPHESKVFRFFDAPMVSVIGAEQKQSY